AGRDVAALAGAALAVGVLAVAALAVAAVPGSLLCRPARRRNLAAAESLTRRSARVVPAGAVGVPGHAPISPHAHGGVPAHGELRRRHAGLGDVTARGQNGRRERPVAPRAAPDQYRRDPRRGRAARTLAGPRRPGAWRTRGVLQRGHPADVRRRIRR